MSQCGRGAEDKRHKWLEHAEHGTTSGFRLQGFWQRISRGRTAAETCSIWESSNMFKVKMMKLLHVFVCIACSVLQCEVQASLLSSFSGAASNHLQPHFLTSKASSSSFQPWPDGHSPGQAAEKEVGESTRSARLLGRLIRSLACPGFAMH